MKKMPKPYEVMETLIEYVNDAYSFNKLNLKGTIQFYLTYENTTYDFFVDVDTQLTLHQGELNDPTVILRSKLYDFLDLASGKLHPVIGVLTRKLMFSGNIGFFKKVMQQKNLFIAGVDIDKYRDEVKDFEKNPHNPWIEPKSVLIINGSPRAKNGYTDFYLRPFIEGLESTDANVEVVYLEKHYIKGCKGCLRCMMSESGVCIHDGKDEFEAIYDKQMKADLIIFAFPLYMDGMTAVLKSYLDRTVRSDYPFKTEGRLRQRHSRRNQKNQTMMVFSICGYLQKENFDALHQHFQQLSITKHMPLIAEIYRPASIYLYNNPLMYKKLNHILNGLKNAGKEVVKYGRISPKTKKIIEQNAEKNDVFMKIANNFFFKKMKNNEKNF